MLFIEKNDILSKEVVYSHFKHLLLSQRHVRKTQRPWASRRPFLGARNSAATSAIRFTNVFAMIIEHKKQYLIRSLIIGGEVLILSIILTCLHYVGNSTIGVTENLYLRGSVILLLSFALSSISTGQVLHHHFVRGDEILLRSLKANFMFFCLTISLLFLLKSHLFHWKFLFPLFVAQTTLNVLYRWSMRWIIKHMRARKSERKGALFVGDLNSVRQQMISMAKDPTTGYTVHGYFSLSPDPDATIAHLYRGTPDQVEAYLSKNETHINELYCTLPPDQTEQIKRIIDFCDNNLIRFIGIPTTYDFINHRATTLTIDGSPAIILRDAPLESLDNRFIKRSFDVVCSFVFLCTLFPIILLIIAPWIKLSSPGPIFFRQKRSGLNGKEFWCYKFRSMRVNAQADKLQATENDPRKTTVGNFMRKTNIDELPQFINVLLGDMSIVGPRPHMLTHTEQYRQLIDKYMVRHFVRPGITGWAQVTGFRGETKELWQMEGRVQKDIWYIEHWKFTLDLWIIIKTIINIGEKNAY